MKLEKEYEQSNKMAIHWENSFNSLTHAGYKLLRLEMYVSCIE